MRTPSNLPSPGWSYEDQALYYTANVLSGLLVGVKPASIPRTIALMSPAENVVASGPFRREHFGVAGDGSYQFRKTSKRSSALTAGYVMARNSASRYSAKQAATPKWRLLDNGTLHLSMEAFYFQSEHGLSPWSFQGVDYAHMVGRSALEFGGTADSGTSVQYRVYSRWSELGLILWSLARNIPHPQLLSLFPPDWKLRA
jgi:hypothetical protein